VPLIWNKEKQEKVIGHWEKDARHKIRLAMRKSALSAGEKGKWGTGRRQKAEEKRKQGNGDRK